LGYERFRPSIRSSPAARGFRFQLDNDVQRLAAEKGSNDPTVHSLAGIYHNLLRRWADA
jgi:PKHD-type hydroxylase